MVLPPGRIGAAAEQLLGFQHAGMVKLSRGMVTLVDREKLEAVGI